MALVERMRGALRLSAVNAAALAMGIAPGMALADARALLPDLYVADADPAGDAHGLAQLAQRCLEWSPLVTPLPPDVITLDITGTDHLFGGEAALSAQVEDAFAALGLTLRHALATTPEAAQALARHATTPAPDERAAIARLPVTALGLDSEATLALQRAGLTDIGALLTRPMASIAARFGADAVTALRRLSGEAQAPIAALAPVAPLRFTRRFAEPIGLQSTIAASFAALLHQAAAVLMARDLGGRAFVLTLYRSDGARHRLMIETGQPTRDPALVLRLFDERIAALADPLDPGFGYDQIRLSVPHTEPLRAVQPDLDGAGQASDALAELIDRLSTRLGPDALRRLVPYDSHLPEQAQRAIPAQGNTPAPWPAPPAAEPPLRPLFLFDPPQPVEVIAEVPDGPPQRFRWRRQLHEVRLFEGPERIAAPWWLHGDAPGLTRDYYRIEDKAGRRYWIFRHGLYEEKPDPRWYIHGQFA
ncbi:Y-family DNA polymerase [Novosphingobium ovatum]